MEVLRAVAAEVDCPLLILGEHIEFSRRFENSQPHGPRMRVSLTTARNTYEHLPVPLPGDHQAVNCGLALAVLDRLATRLSAQSRVISTRELSLRDANLVCKPRHLDGNTIDFHLHLPRTRYLRVMTPYLLAVVDKDVDGMLWAESARR